METSIAKIGTIKYMNPKNTILRHCFIAIYGDEGINRSKLADTGHASLWTYAK
jgi:hypothetical protein